MFVPVSLGTGPEWWVLQRRCKKGGKHLKPFWAKKIVETWPFLNWPWTRSLEGGTYAMCISPSSLSCTLEILIPFHRGGNWSTCISKELAKDTRQDNSRAGLESLSSKSISSARWHWPLLITDSVALPPTHGSPGPAQSLPPTPYHTRGRTFCKVAVYHKPSI